MREIAADRYWGRVVDTMNEALLIISNEGVILSVNRSFEEMTGYTAAEATGKKCTLLECSACELMINDRHAGWCKLFQPNHEDIRRCQCQIVRKDGTRIPALKMHRCCTMRMAISWEPWKPSPISAKLIVWTENWNS